MKISVIVCTWNSERYLMDTIDSVLTQDHKDFEFVFVDGGSTDNTLRYIDEVSGDKRILNNVRGGIAAAMNAGINAASGDAVIHLHSDDYFLHESVLKRAAAAFDNNKCEWLFGRILNRRADGLYPESYVPPNYSYANLLRSNIVPHAATFVRRRLYERSGGFDTRLRYAMDYDMWLRLGKIAEPIQLKEVFSVFRRHEESTTEKNRLGSFDEDHQVRRHYLPSGSVIRAKHELRYWVRRRRLLRSLNCGGLV